MFDRVFSDGFLVKNSIEEDHRDKVSAVRRSIAIFYLIKYMFI